MIGFLRPTEGRVYGALFADDRITGRLEGSSGVEYEMEISLGPNGVGSAGMRDAVSESEFAEYLSDLRMRYGRLPALQDELNRELER